MRRKKRARRRGGGRGRKTFGIII
uniref:Uncharacterized protein n=1 Tax=Lepeophtheirus salmonis TaxID=72036 RepID=A0A0K2V988_LEPSM